MADRVVRNPNAICTHCWLCRNVCPAYKVLQDEIVSPRGKNIAIYSFIDNKIQIDWKYFYEYCNGCEACLAVCPVKRWFDAIRAREQIVKNWFKSKANEEMLENIRKRRNPFWEVQQWKTPDKLYCC